MKNLERTCPKCEHPLSGCHRGPDAKAAIYPVEIIEVACRALEVALMAMAQSAGKPTTQGFDNYVLDIGNFSLRIIHDGLASHEKAIKGES